MNSGPWIAGQARNDSHLKSTLLQFPYPLFGCIGKSGRCWTSGRKPRGGVLRYQTVGWLDGRLVMMVWTPRGAARRIISMRKINERETQAIGARLD